MSDRVYVCELGLVPARAQGRKPACFNSPLDGEVAGASPVAAGVTPILSSSLRLGAGLMGN